jgi:putative Ca2+/H+ antiporter (TMEM165/GDT1 family)
VEAVFIPFLAAALGEIGDKTQWLLVALAAQSRRPGAVLLGMGVAAVANSAMAAAGGALIGQSIHPRAIALLLAVALVFAGAGALITRYRPDVPQSRLPTALAAALLLFGAEFGDKTQFLTAVMTARFDSPALVAGGATAGILTASIPAALVADRFERVVPVRILRWAVAALFLLAGVITGLGALRLT